MPPGSVRPLVVAWRVTEACDLGCWYCEYNRRLHRPRRSARAPEVLVFGRALADYAALSGRTVLVSWLGGEPLLWPPLVEVGQHFRQDLGLTLSLTTNGERLDAPGLIEHLVDSYAEITISVDGQADFHDATRGASGLFERLASAVSTLRQRKTEVEHGPILRANTILMRSNLHEFEKLCESLADWGIEEVTFNALGGSPPGPNYPSERLMLGDIEWLSAELPGIRRRQAARGLAIRGSGRYLDRLASSAQGDARPVIDCHPGAEFLFIDAEGRAAPCSFTSAGYGVCIADIQSGRDLSRLPARWAEARRAAWQAACYDCPSTQVFGKFDLEKADECRP